VSIPYSARDRKISTDDGDAAQDELESRSRAFRLAVRQLDRFARHDQITVLLEGESGTGKTGFARHLHRCSRRRNARFHQVSLAGTDDKLAASDLFGHMAGAFTDARR